MKVILLTLTIFTLFSCSKEKMKVYEIQNTDCIDTISFNSKILSITNNSCFSCHGDGSTSPKISNYNDISNNATLIYNSITGNGVQKMPPAPNEPLADSLIQQFSCWIKQGKLNN